MVKKPIGNVALLAIRPCYSDQILCGKKRVEFRKTPFRREVTHVVLYASKPVMGVVGWFEVKNIAEESPEELWKRYHKVGGIAKKEYDSYFASRSQAIAIEIENVWPLKIPIKLSELGEDLRVPQNYRYLENEVFSKSLERKSFSILSKKKSIASRQCAIFQR